MKTASKWQVGQNPGGETPRSHPKPTMPLSRSGAQDERTIPEADESLPLSQREKTRKRKGEDGEDQGMLRFGAVFSELGELKDEVISLSV